ncbi:MAG: LuxR family transcriptional regulator [Pseudomonadota bacterium]
MDENIHVFIENVEASQSFGALKDACISHFLAIGGKMMSYHHIPPFGAEDHGAELTVIAHGFPEDWVQRYRGERLYRDDPIPRYALQTAKPFWWSDATDFPSLTKRERRYLKVLEEAKLGDGLALPVYGPNGRDGYASLGFGLTRPELSAVAMRRVQWACQVAHERYCQLLCDETKERVTLSPREQEILSWVARGKSNSVIAQIIGISANTVDTYMRRIYAKLHVVDRVTAALRAVAIGAL